MLSICDNKKIFLFKHFMKLKKIRLDNLVAIIDVNRLGQSEVTPVGHDLRLIWTE